MTLVSNEAGPLAPYQMRPCIPVEEVPPCLYHRTVEDAAFSILDDHLVPGYGNSGKAHCYFSSLPLEEMSNQSGVRRDLPVEVVFETAAVLKFKIASEGILCIEPVPGSTILYIRDTVKDKILYSRLLDAQATRTGAADQMEDTSPTQVVAVTQSASASTDVAVIPEEPRRRPTTNLEFPCRGTVLLCEVLRAINGVWADQVCHAVPNPGRDTEQRTMGVGSQGSMTYGARLTEAVTARLLYLRDDRSRPD